MAATKLLNLIAVSTLAILTCSFGTAPVTALSVNNVHLAARGPAHAALAKKRRGTTKRCRPRPSTSLTGKPASTAKPPTSTSKAAPAATTTKASTGSSGSSGGVSNSGGNAGSNGGNGKVGLAWAVNDDTALAHFKNPNVGPIYTWSPYVPDAARKLGYEPVPMLWGPKQIPDFQKLVVKGYAKTVLGFNEPNQGGQANLSPQAAAGLWNQYIEPLRNQGYSLISPACTNAPSGKTWIKDFIAACNGCHLDGIAIHFYGTDPQQMINYIQDMHNTFGLPIWPTEFACQNFGGGAQCSKDQVETFMKTVKGFMDGASYVPHYFAFGALYDMGNVNPLNQLLGSNGFPTELGKLYLGN